ncbi:MAG TPA: prolyl oligopeptidase family serine peptidase [Actinomycetota bacterium]|nr:prolyl oligopeptidase family serine peptidase [Actinomycetota bacterium]
MIARTEAEGGESITPEQSEVPPTFYGLIWDGNLIGRAGEPTSQDSPIVSQRVTFKSGDLSLVGYLSKPDGPGPFPTVVWNHGSDPDPGSGPQFASLASMFVPAGYVVFAPMRRGHSDSEGEYIVDAIEREAASFGAAAGQQLATLLLQTSQLDDQLAGLAFVRQQLFVDPARIVVAGWSFGGIQTLLGAESDAGYCAAVSISPAAMMWAGNPDIRARLKTAVIRIRIPVFLIQPPKDASLEPARVLGPKLEQRNKLSRVKIYPAEGPEDEQVHCFGGPKGVHVWASDVLAFLNEVNC